MKIGISLPFILLNKKGEERKESGLLVTWAPRSPLRSG